MRLPLKGSIHLPPKTGLVSLLLLIVVSLLPSVAQAGSANEYSPIIEMGTILHSGTTGKSLTGTTGYYMAFRSEQRKGHFRPEMAAELQMTSGTITLDDIKVSTSVFGAAFLGGFHFFFFKEGSFQPFVGVNGVLGWHSLRMTSPPAGVEPYTQGLSYGYEATAGVDMRFGSAEGTAFRVHSGLWSVASSLAGVSGFQLGGIRISIGLVY